MKQADEIIEVLRKSGNRITKTRRALVEILIESEAPLSVPELLEILAKRALDVNKTTAYRELSFLMAQGVVREIDLLEGLKRYEINTDDCHHHAVCQRCRSITCISIEHRELEPLERSVKQALGFEVHSHTLEFFGLCKNCSKKPEPAKAKKTCCGNH